MKKIYFSRLINFTVAQMLLFAFLIMFHPSCSNAQTKLNSVYAGIEFRQTINGTEVFYPSYYFRQDGTFCSNLNEKDWNTRVDGKYEIRNKIIYVKYSSFDGNDEFAIVSSESIRKNGSLLYKYELANQIPAQTFKQETDYGQVEQLTFDGKGRFKTTGFRNASARDEKTEFDGEGTYTIKNSQLTMLYSDGRKVEKSFFYGGGKSMAALINGSTYNVINPANVKSTSKNSKPTGPEKDANATGSKEQSAQASSGIDILNKANLAHGGAALNKLKTLTLETTIDNIQVVQFIDLPDKKLRVEQRKGNVLISVEQMENTTGWQWKNGKTTSLDAARIKELQQTFTTGVLILRLVEIQKTVIKNYEFDKETGVKKISVRINDDENLLLFDKDNRLVAQMVMKNGTETGTQFQNFIVTGGISLPYTFIVENALGQKYTIKFSSILANPNYTESTWVKL